MWFGLVLAIGALASFALARLLKRRTFGLELDEIARLLQEREATLHGIREGVIAIDPAGGSRSMNDEAQRLLRLPPGVAATAGSRTCCPAARCATPSPARRRSRTPIVVTDDYCLVVNRMPVMLAGRPHGSVVTLQDRTEVDGAHPRARRRAQLHRVDARPAARVLQPDARIAGLLESGGRGGAGLPQRDPRHVRPTSTRRSAPASARR